MLSYQTQHVPGKLKNRRCFSYHVLYKVDWFFPVPSYDIVSASPTKNEVVYPMLYLLCLRLDEYQTME